MSERYVVTSRANTTRAVFHTDTECPRLSESTIRPTTEHEIDHFDLVECSFCAGSNDGAHQDETEWHKINQALQNGEIQL